MNRLLRLFAIAYVFAVGGARAQVDKYHITAAEQAACQTDAQRLCLATYPDEDRLIACMKANRKALSSTCAPVFEAGLRRRGLY